MTTIHPSSLRGLLGDAVAAAAKGGTSMGTSNDPAGFASLLRQTHAAPAPMPPKAPTAAPPPKPVAQESASPDEATNDSKPPQASTDAANRARALLKGKPPTADDAAPNALDTKPARDAAKADGPAEASDAATEVANAAQTKAATDPAAAPIDPNVMHWLAGLQRAASAQASDAGVDADAKTITADTADSATESRGTAKGLRAADLEADADLKDKVAQGKAQRDAAADAAGARELAGVLAEQRIGEKPVTASSGAVARTNDAAAAAASAVASAPTSGSQAPAPAGVAITMPINAPEVAQELGLRLSVLAQGGVQTAELHLNPADMGPVSVQIVMDGTQARIDFGADMAATRRAIEAGLPELASALADAGFTLAGGGVSQHGGGHGGRGESASPEGERARHIAVDDETKRVATAARRIVTQGGVDLFA